MAGAVTRSQNGPQPAAVTNRIVLTLKKNIGIQPRREKASSQSSCFQESIQFPLRNAQGSGPRDHPVNIPHLRGRYNTLKDPPIVLMHHYLRSGYLLDPIGETTVIRMIVSNQNVLDVREAHMD